MLIVDPEVLEHKKEDMKLILREMENNSKPTYAQVERYQKRMGPIIFDTDANPETAEALQTVVNTPGMGEFVRMKANEARKEQGMPQY